jgi:uncharacterized membrane protein
VKTNTMRVSFAAILGALYTVLVIFLAPISFGVYQVRLADALLPLSMIFGVPSAIGFSLGCVVSNVYGGLGVVDIVGGAVANFVACTLAWYIARKSQIGTRLLGSAGSNRVWALGSVGWLYYCHKHHWISDSGID